MNGWLLFNRFFAKVAEILNMQFQSVLLKKKRKVRQRIYRERCDTYGERGCIIVWYSKIDASLLHDRCDFWEPSEAESEKEKRERQAALPLRDSREEVVFDLVV